MSAQAPEPMTAAQLAEEARGHVPNTEFPDSCYLCEYSWPCPTARLLKTVEELQRSNAILTEDRSAQRWAIEAGVQKGKAQLADQRALDLQVALEQRDSEIAGLKETLASVSDSGVKAVADRDKTIEALKEENERFRAEIDRLKRCESCEGKFQALREQVRALEEDKQSLTDDCWEWKRKYESDISTLRSHLKTDMETFEERAKSARSAWLNGTPHFRAEEAALLQEIKTNEVHASRIRAALGPEPEQLDCSCHSGSVCNAACRDGKHHGGCFVSDAPATPEPSKTALNKLTAMAQEEGTYLPEPSPKVTADEGR